jgi:hypothetical protein
MNRTGLLESIKPTKHKVNEHLSDGEWIRTGLLESIKPTKHNVNEHLSDREWIRTGLLESIKPTKHKVNEHLSGPSPDSFTTTEMFVDLVFSRFDTF